jgi:hypothetical protein
LTRSPIPKVLSTFREHEVATLLMGGQACILYGAAEFSRDIDFCVLSSEDNLERLRCALSGLEAEPIAVPPFERAYLERGHAVHFRAHHPEASGLRVDIMSRLRGVDPFGELWERRTTLELPGHGALDVLSLPDLVQSKKTQRDKDWGMIRRLGEASYARDEIPSAERANFWLRELRTPELLLECAVRFPAQANEVARARVATLAAVDRDEPGVRSALAAEEALEQERDRQYWAPLRAELEDLRRERRSP